MLNILEIADHNQVIADKRLKKLFAELNAKKFVEKFQGWKREDYENRGTVLINPMLVRGVKEDQIEQLFADPNWVVQHKLNGERVTIHIHKKYNRVFSRRDSVKSNWKNEKSDLLPHIRDWDLSDFEGTRLDGEILHPSGNFSEIGSILRSKPQRAWDIQKERGWLFIVVYDITHWKGINIQHFPYRKRLKLLYKFIYGKNGNFRVPFINHISTIYEGMMVDGKWLNPEAYMRYILANGGEGIIFRNLDGKYIQGYNDEGKEQRSYDVLRLKDVDTWDLVVCGYDNSLSLYGGKEIEQNGYWEYWVDTANNILPRSRILNADVMLSKGYRPVTKYFAKKWIGAIKYGVVVPFDELENLPEPLQDAKFKKLPGSEDLHVVEVGQCSGMNDYYREQFSKYPEKYMYQVIEVMANGLTDKETGGLRHPRFCMIRTDKSPAECTWKSHIREWD